MPPELYERIKRRLIAGWGGYPLIGTPAQIVDQLTALAKTGLDGIVSSWVNYHDEMRQWIDEVMPMIEQASLFTKALLTTNRAETRPLRRGQKEGRTFGVIRLRRRDQQGSTHIPTGRSASSTDAFPRKVDGFLTRFAILCARKASSESPHGYTSSQDSEKDSTCGR